MQIWFILIVYILLLSFLSHIPRRVSSFLWTDLKELTLGKVHPSQPWNRAWLMETDSVDTLLAKQRLRTDNIRNTDIVVLM